MKFDALKHQGKVKDDLTMCPVGTKYNTDSAEHIARQEGTSRRQIYRYIHLTNLNKELLEYLDQGIISFNPAVELSYEILEEQKANQKEKLKIDLESLSKFFPRGTTPKEMTEWIHYLLEENDFEKDFIKDDIDLKI